MFFEVGCKMFVYFRTERHLGSYIVNFPDWLKFMFCKIDLRQFSRFSLLRNFFDWLKNAFCKLTTLIGRSGKFCVGIKSVRFPLFFPNQPVCACVAHQVVPIYHEMACYIFALLVFQLSKTIWHEMLKRTLKFHRSFPRIRNSLKLPLETNNGRFSRIFRMPENRIRN